MDEIGYVIDRKNFLVHLDGLPSVKINEIVESESGIRGWVNSLYPEKVEVLLIDEGSIEPGQMFKKKGDLLGLAVGEFLLGRAINPLGVAVDGKILSLKTKGNQVFNLEKTATGIDTREFISDQFISGMTIIDTLIPIGKGQRELIIGDAHSGKTSFLIDMIVNQKNTNTICIYAAIGKPVSQVRNMIDILTANGAINHTIIISALASDPTPLIFLAPKSAFTIAEYFQKNGKDVLLILDDLGNHAKVHREISLLSGKAPGRESYPGDIFYQHAHLMERAGNYKSEYGGGSITTFPVLELNLNDFTGFVPTNIIGMTDGHLLFKSNLRNEGQNPAIDISLSVSRVGRQTQKTIQSLISSKVRSLLAQAQELDTVSHFSSELPTETQMILKQKAQVQEIIKQDTFSYIPIYVQIILLGLIFTPFLQQKSLDFLSLHKNQLIKGLIETEQMQKFGQDVLNLQTEQELFQSLQTITPFLDQLVATNK